MVRSRGTSITTFGERSFGLANFFIHQEYRSVIYDILFIMVNK